MKAINQLSKNLILIGLIACLLMITNSISSQNTSPLCFTARNGSVTVRFFLKTGIYGIQYSTDGTTWSSYTKNTSVTINANQSIYFRASTNQTFATAFGTGGYNTSSRFYFTSTDGGTVEGSGNIMSLYGPDCPDLALRQIAFTAMFYDCTLLTRAPSLPATSLNSHCYSKMFYGCTSLVAAPALPATTLANNCYEYMFYGCTSLVAPPPMPVTTLDSQCCMEMFENCTSMAVNISGPGTAWSIPANNSASNALTDMFKGTSGTMNGTPSAQTIYYITPGGFTATANVNDSTMGSASGTGYYIRGDSVTLTATPKVNHHFVSWSNGDTTPVMTFVIDRDTTLTANFAVNLDYLFEDSATVIAGDSLVWHGRTLTTGGVYYDSLTTALGHDSVYKLTLRVTPKPLCFTARNGSVTVRFDIKNVTYTIQYSTDRTTWNTYTSNTGVTINANQSIYFRAATNRTYASSFGANGSPSHFYFSSTDGGTVEGSGNIMSLYGPDCPDVPLQPKEFFSMFDGCTLLTTAPDLPATTLASYCYGDMFDGCESLTSAPALPATTLAEGCYASMFEGCTSLTAAPSLPATTMANYCYKNMFEGCTSLTAAPSLPATTLADYCYYRMFYNCTSLTSAPALPATTLADYCYGQMFLECTSLTSAPALAATTLADYCCYYMFNGCTSLTTAPALPATTLAVRCYQNMFDGCTSLTAAPALPATTLTSSCYLEMFRGCTSLTIAPALPATTLADYCYLWMFYDCTSLTVAPALSATTLNDYCYSGMFHGCTSLTAAPALPATTLASFCYSGMFQGCTFLKVPPSLPATTLAGSCYKSMFRGCTSMAINTDGPGITWSIPATVSATSALTDMFTGTIGTMNGTPSVQTTYYIPFPSYLFEDSAAIFTGDSLVWRGKTLKASGIYYDSLTTVYGYDSVYKLTFSVFSNPLCFTARNGSVTVRFVIKNVTHTILYSTDRTTWKTYTSNTGVTIKANQSIYFSAATNQTVATAFGSGTYDSSCFYFTSTNGGTVEGSGNIMSLYGPDCPDLPLSSKAFEYMFYNCTSLTSAPALPATTLATYCYNRMFYNCKSLTSAPALPATTLASCCYCDMFLNCTSLTAAPALPATTLAGSCYRNMFDGCTSLTAAPALPATTLATYCYAYMFSDCTSLITAPSLPADSLAEHCYYMMFSGCRSLTAAPALPATTLAEHCYCAMFENCRSLTVPPSLPATTLAKDCYQLMFDSCSSLTAAPALPATTLAEACYWKMFEACTSIMVPPSLPATTLADKCYEYMFRGCTSMVVNTAGPGNTWSIPASVSASYSLAGMFARTSGTMNNTPSVRTTYYIPSPDFLFEDSTLIFTGDSLVWRGKTLTTAGVYYDSLITVRGYDSVYKMTLRVVSNPLCFTARNGSVTVRFNIKYVTHTILYSTDGTNWNTYTPNTNVTISANQSIYFSAAANQTVAKAFGAGGVGSRFYFTSSNGGNVEGSGNIMSLYGPGCLDLPLPQYALSQMFVNCTLLTTAPDLPATTLGAYCYYFMFQNCPALTTAPDLPATTLGERCYFGMFQECTSLTTPPAVLPADTLANHCYRQMFYGCTSLATTPVLPATTLADRCYTFMFIGCTALTAAPALPATTLADGCYAGMFQDCTALTAAPALPATTLAYACYSSMFNGCTSLTAPPSLPATTLAESCYNGMFGNCTSMVVNIAGPGIPWSIPATATVSLALTNMFQGTSGTMNGSPAIQTTYYIPLPSYLIEDSATIMPGDSLVWRGRTLTTAGVYYDSLTSVQGYDSVYKMTLTVTPKPLCFTARNGSVTVRFDIYNVTHTIQYSTNGTTWNTYTSGTNVTINANQSIYFRAASNQNVATAFGGNVSGSRFYFTSTDGGTVEGSGNIMSLYGPDCPDLSLQSYAFASMFYNCTTLTAAPALSATTLADYCYQNMFYGCTSLTAAPALPANTLAKRCYAQMFQRCTSLTVAPTLAAITLAERCCELMFSHCTTLTAAPALPATALAEYCYCSMFDSCTSLTTPPSLPAVVLSKDCYYLMFLDCTSLSAAPSLPATTLADACYSSMFRGCTSLSVPPSLPATTLVGSCYNNMFKNCTSMVVNKAGPGITWSIPAPVSSNYALFHMFSGTSGTMNSTPSVQTTYYIPLPSYLFEDSATIMAGDSLLWRGRTLTTAGVYYDSLTSVQGYDSVYKMTLTVTPKPLCFTARNGSVTVRFDIYNVTHTIQYSTNGTTWNTYTSGTNVTINANQSIYFRAATNQTVATPFISDFEQDCSQFLFDSSSGGTVEGSGNIMSLYGPDCPDLPLQTGAFAKMFYFCHLLTTAPDLPATTLAYGCYASMFSYCASLTAAPSLPATTLAEYCYVLMFNNCNSLTAPPSLPAATLVDYCYNNMFSGCNSMVVNIAGPGATWSIQATNTATNALTDMFAGTGGTMNGTPSIQTTYYLSSGVLTAIANVNDTTMGSVSGAGIYYYKDTVTLTATPKAHHHFVNWSNGDTTLVLTFVIDRDTTFTANFAANPTYLFEDNATICQGCSYSWRGRNLTAEGVYYDSLTTVLGEDSIYKLTLTVNPTYFMQESHAICQGGSYTWHGKNLTTTGVYYDSLQTIAGCDSVYKLTLTVNPTYLSEDNATICQGNSYSWHGKNLTTAGVYYDSLQTIAGCDSVYKLTLTVNPTYLFEDNATICQGNSYSWHGKNLTTTGVYYDSLQTIAGCDSVYKLALTVNPTYLFEDNATICQGNSYSWHGKNLTTAGVYYDSLQTIAGCDSVYKLTLTVNPTYLFEDNATICQGNSYSWHGKNLTTARVYYDSLQTIAGCDSVYKLTLTVNPTYLFEDNATICQGNSYTWHGKNLTTTGVYYDSLQTIAGCDSVYKLTLTVNPTYFIQESQSICQGGSYSWHGRNLTTTGVYYDSLQTRAGCDSIHRLTLTVNPTYLFEDNATICQGNSYSWRGKNLTTTGVYFDSLQTIAGCDSVYKLTLTVNPSYLFEDSTIICRGDIYPWHGKSITTPGVYYDTLATSTGCDSVYKLTVTINQYNVTLSTNDPTVGTVAGGGRYDCGDNVTITATAEDACYSFDKWSDGNTNNPRSIVVASDTSLTAIFKKNVYTVTVSPNMAKAGVTYCITDGGKDTTITVECGETVEIHAESMGQYHFTEWSDGSTDSTRVITVTSDSNLVAIFKSNCGDMTHWPAELKFNNLIIINLNALKAEGYYPDAGRISWYMAVGDVDKVEGVFPMDDQFVCTGYYMSLIDYGLGAGRYYAVIDASREIGTPCDGNMKSEIVEYIPGSQQIRIEVAPTKVRNGELVTVSGLNPEEMSIVRVYDYTGKLMEVIESNGTEQCQIQTAGCAGVYMINVTTETVNKTFRFVVTK